ncbi:MAG: nucleotidyltransferase domain-containing protein [Gemmatimonadetes bacterium]|nr:nucleotidyltransferase domain-containing protein [Gemmatimonadota bacterium]
MVTHFVLHPYSVLHFRALQRVTGLSSRSLQQELARLVELGMLRREREGRKVYFRADAGHPRWQVFRQMVREFADPAEVLGIALAEVPGIEGAFIYGSFAPGTDIHPESDIDVFVLGSALEEPETRLALSGEALEAAGLLGREVNVTRYTPQKLADRQARSARFIRSVMEGEKVWLVGDEAVLRPSID